MNFLWHNQLAKEICGQLEVEQPRDFCFGSIAPDFAAMGRGRVIRVKDAHDRAALPPVDQTVQRGVDFHYYIDQHYDQLPAANDARSVIRDHVSSRHPRSSRLLTRLMPVLALDLMLDGFLLSQNPQAHEELSDSLDTIHSAGRARISTNPIEFVRVAQAFQMELPDYRNSEVVAGLIGAISLRRLGRPLERYDREAAVLSVRTLGSAVLEEAPEIINGMRQIASDFESSPS